MKKILLMGILSAVLVMPAVANAEDGPGWAMKPLPIKVNPIVKPPITTNEDGPGW